MIWRTCSRSAPLSVLFSKRKITWPLNEKRAPNLGPKIGYSAGMPGERPVVPAVPEGTSNIGGKSYVALLDKGDRAPRCFSEKSANGGNLHHAQLTENGRRNRGLLALIITTCTGAEIRVPMCLEAKKEKSSVCKKGVCRHNIARRKRVYSSKGVATNGYGQVASAKARLPQHRSASILGER